MKWLIRVIEATIVLALVLLMIFNSHLTTLHLGTQLAFSAPLMVWIILSFILGVVFSALMFAAKHMLLARQLRKAQKKLNTLSTQEQKAPG
jgi:uncharacterized integral membrane protein